PARSVVADLKSSGPKLVTSRCSASTLRPGTRAPVVSSTVAATSRVAGGGAVGCEDDFPQPASAMTHGAHARATDPIVRGRRISVLRRDPFPGGERWRPIRDAPRGGDA